MEAPIDIECDLAALTREELLNKVCQLRTHNKQLKHILAKANESKFASKSRKKFKREKEFDFSRFSKRHILLKFYYLGWDRHGYAVQEDTNNTVEAQLFDALLKTKLIESRETSDYHRCGRTDKGVSAFSQVVSITMRSRFTPDEIEVDNQLDHSSKESLELNYPQILNRVLPSDIRVLAWCPVPDGFSARFDCVQRTYKYFFPLGDLNLKAMNEAAQFLVGQHDFRNFCKMDVGNGVVNFIRRIQSVYIQETNKTYHRVTEIKETSPINMEIDSQIKEPYSLTEKCETIKENYIETEKCETIKKENYIETEKCETIKEENYIETEKCDSVTKEIVTNRSSSYIGKEIRPLEEKHSLCVLTIIGNAFLWHQIRAIMTVLLLVGEGKEKTDIVQKLLDVHSNPRKPQYGFANEISLNLYETSYDEKVRWRFDKDNLKFVIQRLQTFWAEHAIKSTMVHCMLSDLSSCFTDNFGDKFPPFQQESFCLQEPNTKVYKPLLERHFCMSLEDRVKHYVGKRRLDPSIMDQIKNSQKKTK